MSIPPQGDDSDILLSYIVDEYERLATVQPFPGREQLAAHIAHAALGFTGEVSADIRSRAGIAAKAVTAVDAMQRWELMPDLPRDSWLAAADAVIALMPKLNGPTQPESAIHRPSVAKLESLLGAYVAEKISEPAFLDGIKSLIAQLEVEAIPTVQSESDFERVQAAVKLLVERGYTVAHGTGMIDNRPGDDYGEPTVQAHPQDDYREAVFVRTYVEHGGSIGELEPGGKALTAALAAYDATLQAKGHCENGMPHKIGGGTEGWCADCGLPETLRVEITDEMVARAQRAYFGPPPANISEPRDWMRKALEAAING